MTTGEIITLLQARGFRFTHSLGQNFLIDDEMLEEIVRASGASGRNVLEIGAGAGCLTNVLARSAKRFSLPWCRRAVVRCGQVDLAMKSTGQDGKELLTTLMLELANPVRK